MQRIFFACNAPDLVAAYQLQHTLKNLACSAMIRMRLLFMRYGVSAFAMPGLGIGVLMNFQRNRRQV
jgi:hypothetical protein